MEAGTSLRYFSGDDCDHREYRRWKQWALNKMRTMDKLPEEARGSFIWTLLSGKALEVVEHLKESDYQVKGGEAAIFNLLDRRWPELDRTDEIGENIAEVFALKAKEGESVRVWCARARECFDKCARKTGVKFPDEARGWILLNCSGMSEEHRAVCLARAQGDLKFDQLAQAMRSCFPDYVVPKKKAYGAHAVEEAFHGPTDDDGFQDVELFLTEHGYEDAFTAQDDGYDPEGIDEDDAAEILAATWREKRAELNMVQKGRKFTASDGRRGQFAGKDTKRSFRIQVEELKQRTRCRKCGKIGHWQRECKSTGASTSGASSHASHAAGAVQVVEQDGAEHFICTAATCGDVEVMLVSSPGYAILDSGCGKTIIGRSTYEAFCQIWKTHGIPCPSERAEKNSFRFGNGQQETSTAAVDMPVYLAGRPGYIKAAIVKGAAPLLLSRPAMQRLGAQIDFATDQLSLFSGKVNIPMEINPAGQYSIRVTDFPDDASSKFPEPIPASETPESPCLSVEYNHHINKCKDYWEYRPQDRTVIRHHLKPRTHRFTPCNTQCPVEVSRLQHVRVTQVNNPTSIIRDLQDDWTNPMEAHAPHDSKPWTGKTVFRLLAHALPPSLPSTEEEQLHIMHWTAKQHRQLMAQVKAPSRDDSDRYDVIEVFSPPRFGLEGSKLGMRVLSADLCTGWDFRKRTDREALMQHVRVSRPKLLVCCPPCTWAGGWWHLNRLRMSPNEVRTREFWTQLFIKFCCELMELQYELGGQCLFEHPRDSMAWKLPSMEKLSKKMHIISVDMCCYGLRVPGGDLIRKATRLLVSHAEMRALAKQCPGSSHASHRTHQVVAGQHAMVGSISKHAAKYTPAFVKAVLRLVRGLPVTDCLVLVDDSSTECLVAHTLAELNEESDEKVKTSLKRLHQNLGHPTNQHMLRILKHGGASQTAIDAARDFHCDQCLAQKSPKVALPAQPQRVVEFNALVGVDIKYLPGWGVNQRIPAVNIIDHASSLQIVAPIFQRENSQILKRVFMERWVSWAGMPQEIVCDPHKANLADAFASILEQGGATFKLIAADAHWQLGKVEVHGGWFARVLEKVLSEHVPVNQEQWIDCVNAAHCKNQLIQVYGMTPSQFVFGKNPRIPENLLDEPLDVVPATSSLYEEALAKQVAIRQSARKAVLDLQDSKSLRLALAARPRTNQWHEPGTYVAFWRSQKWIHGSLDRTGRWHGPAVVLGYVGRNVVLIHKRQIFRCAPEQVRPSTQDEKKLVETPQMDLLGIKHLVESGKLDSKQYIDLVPEQYPGLPAMPSGEPVPADEPSSVSDRAEHRATDPSSVRPSEPRVNSQPPPLSSVGDNQVPVEDKATDYQAEPYVRSGSTKGIPEPPRNAETVDPETGYGPVRPARRRIPQKDGPAALYRPSRMAQDDFQEMTQEIVPQLINRVMGSAESTPSGSEPVEPESTTEPHKGLKRPADEPGPGDQPPGKKPSQDMDELYVQEVGQTYVKDEVAICSVECLKQYHHSSKNHDLSLEDINDLVDMYQKGACHEALVAAYVKKKASKELPVIGNAPEIQIKIDEAKLLEWNTILAKHAARLVLGPEADNVRQHLSHRIMGSRYVITVKQEDDSAPRMKARWCLQGHLDPDLSEKAMHGDLQSPTLSQVGRNMLFQLIASHQWNMALGDIKGAFLAAGNLPQRYRPLYASLPRGGIPGVPENALIEICGHVYGLNDSPAAWYKKLHHELIQVGFERSRFDSCLFYFREHGVLTGVYGVHVDDCVTGGNGPGYNQAIDRLRKTFEFRKWRLGSGDFCGSQYEQDPQTYEITMNQERFSQKIRPLHLSRERARNRDAPLDPKEISCLRAINGSLNWLANQSRPDLATQVSFSQQAFPTPTVGDAIAANHAVRRAKQHADQSIRFCAIPPENLGLMCHSDAAFANAKAGATQAGYMVSFVHEHVNQGMDCQWSPAFWKSSRLPRVVSSTLSAEAQSMSTASSMLEWASLLMSEALDGPRWSHSLWEGLGNRLIMLVTDCKSLYDHLTSQSSPTLDDRRTAIDIVILRDSVHRLKANLRWIPTNRMLADSLTKESPEAFDLLRACLRSAKYQISPEELVLERRALERERRKQFASKPTGDSSTISQGLEQEG